MSNNLSFSRINTYQECSYKYFIHYVEKIRPITTNSSLAFGKAIDDGLNTLLETRDLDKALSTFRVSWGEVSGESDIKYTKSDLDLDLVEGYTNQTAWMCLFIKGEMLLRAYNEQILPKIKRVVEVQQKVFAENETGDSINGALDAIIEWEDGKVYLADNKTTSVKYKENSANESEQLALYHFIKKDEVKLDGVMFIVMNKTLNKVNVKTCLKCGEVVHGKNIKLCSKVTDEVRCNGELKQSYTFSAELYTVFGKASDELEQQILTKFDIVNHAIKSKTFEKNYEACHGKYGKCAYFNYCKYGNDEGYKKDDSTT